jgi:hypothetical protein
MKGSLNRSDGGSHRQRGDEDKDGAEGKSDSADEDGFLSAEPPFCRLNSSTAAVVDKSLSLEMVLVSAALANALSTLCARLAVQAVPDRDQPHSIVLAAVACDVTHRMSD